MASQAEFETLVGEIAQLSNAIREGGLIDSEKLKAEFATQFKALTDMQAQQKLDEAPDRRVPGALVGPNGEVLSKSNRYHGMLKNFERDGSSRHGATKIKAIDLWMSYNLLRGAHAAMPERVAKPSDDLALAVKAMTAEGVGTGAELVPTDMANQLWDDMYLASRVIGLMQQVNMTSSPFDLPLGLGRPTWRKGRERTRTTTEDSSTNKVTLTATEIVADQEWSYTFNEDAVVALMPAMRTNLALSGGEAMDAFALNADSTLASSGNINSDDATPDVDSYYLTEGQDGIRHQHLVDNAGQTVDAGGDALADADITAALGRMGKYATDPNKLALITDVSTYLGGFLKLDTVTTLDKFGPSAVVLTGQLGSYRGVPIVLSESYNKAEADGKQSANAASNTLGGFSVMNRSMWAVGFMRDLLIEVDRDIRSRTYIMVSSFRQAVAAHGTRSTNKHTAGARNIAV
ncbi:phage major capsid protein [Herpetosiphon sp. NSE202]|uniref:phage major capsid protein n=1 Tax=Herpetosiphon sp. NSE202 TaxID=3351349 RepID=UPI003641C087